MLFSSPTTSRLRRAPAERSRSARLLWPLWAALLAACSSNPVAPVIDRSAARSARHTVALPAEYTVANGDTLYGIAFRHGLDFKLLASWNRIPAPYTIYPGRRLRLTAPGRGASAPSVVAPVTRSAPPVARRDLPKSQPAQPATRPPTTSIARNPPATTGAAPTQVPSVAPTIATAEVPVAAWRWPTLGRLLSSFAAGDPTRQGIDIAGIAGQPVLAAAAGEVVYSGNGLIGYGELVIVKHDATFLSAYGHNRKRLVVEGQRVKSGEAIAEMGASGAARDMLHFEIRRKGKPVDPLLYLPKR